MIGYYQNKEESGKWKIKTLQITFQHFLTKKELT